MGSILDFFRGKRPSKTGDDDPRVVGRSPGGSRLIKYGGGEFDRPKIGFIEEDLSELIERREKVYGELFGKTDIVHHELLPFVPHIDVYRFLPADARPFVTYVTSGMSDLPQHSPPDLGAQTRRVEIAFYAAEPRDDYAELLRRLGHFVHDNETWLYWGHSMPNGTPPEPVFGMPPLDGFLFMPSIVSPDNELADRLEWQGDPVNLLWCVPVTTAELNYKLEHGIDAIYDLFDRVQHPFVFSGPRESYV